MTTDGNTPFFVLHQQRTHIHKHRVRYYSLKLEDSISIEVLPATQEGLLKALMHVLPGYNVKLITFKEVHRPDTEEELIALCQGRIAAGKFKEIKSQIRGHK